MGHLRLKFQVTFRLYLLSIFIVTGNLANIQPEKASCFKTRKFERHEYWIENSLPASARQIDYEHKKSCQPQPQVKRISSTKTELILTNDFEVAVP